jgi:hypothetical protein
MESWRGGTSHRDTKGKRIFEDYVLDEENGSDTFAVQTTVGGKKVKITATILNGVEKITPKHIAWNFDNQETGESPIDRCGAYKTGPSGSAIPMTMFTSSQYGKNVLANAATGHHIVPTYRQSADDKWGVLCAPATVKTNYPVHRKTFNKGGVPQNIPEAPGIYWNRHYPRMMTASLNGRSWVLNTQGSGLKGKTLIQWSPGVQRAKKKDVLNDNNLNVLKLKNTTVTDMAIKAVRLLPSLTQAGLMEIEAGPSLAEKPITTC